MRSNGAQSLNLHLARRGLDRVYRAAEIAARKYQAQIQIICDVDTAAVEPGNAHATFIVLGPDKADELRVPILATLFQMRCMLDQFFVDKVAAGQPESQTSVGPQERHPMTTKARIFHQLVAQGIRNAYRAAEAVVRANPDIEIDVELLYEPSQNSRKYGPQPYDLPSIRFWLIVGSMSKGETTTGMHITAVEMRRRLEEKAEELTQTSLEPDAHGWNQEVP